MLSMVRTRVNLTVVLHYALIYIVTINLLLCNINFADECLSKSHDTLVDALSRMNTIYEKAKQDMQSLITKSKQNEKITNTNTVNADQDSIQQIPIDAPIQISNAPSQLQIEPFIEQTFNKDDVYNIQYVGKSNQNNWANSFVFMGYWNKQKNRLYIGLPLIENKSNSNMAMKSISYEANFGKENAANTPKLQDQAVNVITSHLNTVTDAISDDIKKHLQLVWFGKISKDEKTFQQDIGLREQTTNYAIWIIFVQQIPTLKNIQGSKGESYQWQWQTIENAKSDANINLGIEKLLQFISTSIKLTQK